MKTIFLIALLVGAALCMPNTPIQQEDDWVDETGSSGGSGSSDGSGSSGGSGSSTVTDKELKACLIQIITDLLEVGKLKEADMPKEFQGIGLGLGGILNTFLSDLLKALLGSNETTVKCMNNALGGSFEKQGLLAFILDLVLGMGNSNHKWAVSHGLGAGTKNQNILSAVLAKLLDGDILNGLVELLLGGKSGSSTVDKDGLVKELLELIFGGGKSGSSTGTTDILGGLLDGLVGGKSGGKGGESSGLLIIILKLLLKGLLGTGKPLGLVAQLLKDLSGKTSVGGLLGATLGGGGLEGLLGGLLGPGGLGVLGGGGSSNGGLLGSGGLLGGLLGGGKGGLLGGLLGGGTTGGGGLLDLGGILG